MLAQEVPRDLSTAETLRLIQEQGGLAGVPHPFDRLRCESLVTGVLERLADRLDFLEVFNARVTLPEDSVGPWNPHCGMVWSAQRAATPTAGSS